MDALYNLVFACFMILIVVNIFFYILASNNTVEGEEYSPHGLNVHKLFSKKIYTKSGNFFRKVAISCWIASIMLMIILFFLM